MNWSFGFQHQVAPSVIAALQYVGSSGWDQNNGRQINTLPLTNDPSNPWSTAAVGGSVITPPSDSRWVPGNPYSDRYAQRSGQVIANKLRNIRALPISTRKRTKPIRIIILCRPVSALRTSGDLPLNLRTPTRTRSILRPIDLNGLPNPFWTSYNKGSGGLDRRHIFNASYVYALPFGDIAPT